MKTTITTAKGIKGLSAYNAYVSILFNVQFCRKFTCKKVSQDTLIIALKCCETIEEYQEIADKLSTANEELKDQDRDYVTAFKSLDDEMKKAILIEAITIYEPNDTQVYSLLSLHSDANGVALSQATINNLDSIQIYAKLLESLLHLSMLDMDFGLLDNVDIETLGDSRVDIDTEAVDLLSGNPEMKTEDVIPLSVKRVLTKHKNA